MLRIKAYSTLLCLSAPPQALGKIYAVLTDKHKRALYDEEGIVEEDDASVLKDQARLRAGPLLVALSSLGGGQGAIGQLYSDVSHQPFLHTSSTRSQCMCMMCVCLPMPPP